MSTRILLVDDHQIIRDGLRVLLQTQKDFDLIAEAEDGHQAVQLTDKLRPDVVVMDLSMPNLNGVEATRQIKHQHPATPIVILTAHADQKLAIEAMKAGAMALVPKSGAFDELAQAIRSVVIRKVYLSPHLRGEIAGAILHLPAGTDHNGSGPLSPREREVLQLMSEGKPTKQIARQLDVCVKTVETHRRQIMQKLQIDNVAELTKYAVREGLTAL